MSTPYYLKLSSRCLGLLCALALSLPLVARAQPYQAGGIFPQGYEKLVDQAIHAYRLRKFVEARAQFARANALFPNARTLRGLAMVEFELGNFVDCVLLLRRALESGERPLRGQLRQDTFALLARASAFVAELSIQSNAKLTAVLVDGRGVELGDGRTLVLSAAAHELEFRSDNLPAQRISFRLRGGDRRRIQVVFPEAASTDVEPGLVEPLAEPPAPAPETDPSSSAAVAESASEDDGNVTNEASPTAPPAVNAAETTEQEADEQVETEHAVPVSAEAPSRDDALLGVGAAPSLESEQFAADDLLRVGGEMLLRVQSAGLKAQSGRDYIFSAPSPSRT